jgi:hypothetical protein
MSDKDENNNSQSDSENSNQQQNPPLRDTNTYLEKGENPETTRKG